MDSLRPFLHASNFRMPLFFFFSFPVIFEYSTTWYIPANRKNSQRKSNQVYETTGGRAVSIIAKDLAVGTLAKYKIRKARGFFFCDTLSDKVFIFRTISLALICFFKIVLDWGK